MKYLVLILGILAACKPTSESSEVKTDLGASGNSAVKQRFQTYLAAREHFQEGCNASTNLKRVIVTGFGLFSGVDSNISGAVSNSMSDERFYSDSNDTDALADSQRPASMTAGVLNERDYSSRSKVRVLTLDNSQYEICFLTLDVVWDLAAAIIINEARIFNPDLIIMSGLNAADSNGLTLEGGAINRAVRAGSYESSGARVDITPVRGATILPESLPGVQRTLPMTWNNSQIAADIKDLVEAIDSSYVVRTPSSARTSNDYICNNVSYAVLAAMKGVAVELAGGEIKLGARRQKAKAGFLHYPDNSQNNSTEVAGWSKVMAKIITSELGSNRQSRPRRVQRNSWYSRWWN